MKKLVTLLVLSATLASPALPQEREAEQGFSLMEEGARMIMRGLMSEVGPTIDGLRATVEDLGPELRDFMAEMGPALAAVMRDVDDIRNYTPPAILPNGDIILRRKPGAPAWQPAADRDEIDL